MLLSSRFLLGCVALAVFWGVAAAPVAAADDAAPDGAIPINYNPAAHQIGVSIASTSTPIQQLMQRAFSLHGAFNPGVAADKVEYTLTFTPDGDQHMTVTAMTSKPGGSFKVEASGTNLNDAAYRAGDAVVQQLTHRPGFFAGKLAFVRKSGASAEIWTSDLLGQSPSPLTNDHSTAANPRWSPDGTRLLYMSYYKSGFPDIILQDVYNHTRSTFSSREGINTGGVFSPDGSKVALILSGENGSTELYTADANGGNFHRITHEAKVSSKASPTWSPDGKSIILAADPQGSPLLYEIPAAGGALQRIRVGGSNYDAEPAWNPTDPNLITFMEQNSGGSLQVFTYNFKTGDTTLMDDGSQPCWANDGRHIIYTKRVNRMDQLYIVDSVTDKKSPLTTRGAADPAFVYTK